MNDLFEQPQPVAEPVEEKKNLKWMIQDVRNARANISMLDPADVSAQLDATENLEQDLLLLCDEITEYENQAEALKLYMKDIQARKSRLERSAETLRNIILQAMDINGLETIPGIAATLSISRKKPTIKVTDEALVPSRFFKPQAPKLDKKALAAEYKESGEIFAGCDMDNGGVILTIRRK